MSFYGETPESKSPELQGQMRKTPELRRELKNVDQSSFLFFFKIIQDSPQVCLPPPRPKKKEQKK